MKKSLPLTGLLAMILLSALAVACGSNFEGDDSGPAIGEAADRANQAPPAGFLDGDVDVAAGPVGDGSVLSDPNSALPALDRQIIRTATVDLTVDDVAGAMQLIETTAIGVGGFVSGSSLTVESGSGDDDGDVRQRGTITVRVPADRYTQVRSDIIAFATDGELTPFQENTTEVTEEYTDLQSRLRNFEATEAQYLELLVQAESIEDILTVQDRLNGVRSQIEQVTGRLQVLDDQTALATITVSLSLPSAAPPVVNGGSQGWATEALENAWNASEEMLKVMGIVAITAGVFAAWLAVPGLVILAAWWFVAGRRSRSETPPGGTGESPSSVS